MILRFTPLAALVGLGAVAAVVACGSLSDPAIGSKAATPAVTTNDGNAVVEKVSGAITGSGATDGLHVALVWRAADSTLHVQGESAVTDTKFSFDLTPPPSSYLVDPASTNDLVGYAPSTAPLQVAQAGFIVYQDTNGNGTFDLDPISGATSDTIVGSDYSLLIEYYVGGGDTDYQAHALSGITPHAGYNLLWRPNAGTAAGVNQYWLGLDAIELPLTIAPYGALAPEVCGGVQDDVRASIKGNADPFATIYPRSVQCSADGYSFSLADWSIPNCEVQPASICQPPGWGPTVVCKPGADAGADGGYAFAPGSPLPSNWPCAVDGGVFVDGGFHGVPALD